VNASQLTKKEKKILAKVAKPHFPSVFFWCIIVAAAEGISAIVLSFRDCLVASEMTKHENPEAIMVLLESSFLLLVASTALFSAIWWTVIRSYGMLLRKLGSAVLNDEGPETN
jgi:hypothetical protein